MLQRQSITAIHHSTEITTIVRKYFSSDGDSAEKPIVSDGGPDHQVTFLSVKVAMIALFRALNLDMYVGVCEDVPTSKLAKYCRKDHVHTKSCSNECISLQIRTSWRT